MANPAPKNIATTATSAGVIHDPGEAATGGGETATAGETVEYTVGEAISPARTDADGDGHDDATGQFTSPQPARLAVVKPKRAGQVLKKGKAPPSPEDLGNNPDALVVVRITEKGGGKVHDGAGGRYDRGDEVALPLAVAQRLRGDPDQKKSLGYVEILGRV